jgi:4-aminobutyrate aminotransferase/(S)-3-amino-2-methylpropionate transaminase
VNGEALLPEVVTPIPGPRSRALAARLARVECPDTTFCSDDFPVFWERASGANVWDADGNRYVDLTSAFGVAALGHGHPRIVAAIRAQAARLVHGMGDVHPSALKVQVAERLAELAPGDVCQSLFGNAGFEAVEAALKTSALATRRPGVVAFAGAYHGLGYGALAATWGDTFRGPFRAQLNPHVVHLPFPGAHAGGAAGPDVLQALEALLASPAGEAYGAVLVEPIQGRAGIRIAPPEFLAGLRDVCTRRGRLLIVDEILTGLGRTGRWFDCERAGIGPDLLCVGKALGGGLPLSACVGTPAAMQAWGRSTGEARHTTTHLGNPLACAAALASLDALRDEGALERVRAREPELRAALQRWRDLPGVRDVRGLGMMWGVELATVAGGPDAPRAFAVVLGALRRGVLLLADGVEHNVLTILPPFGIAPAQLEAGLEAVRQALLESPPGPGGAA